MVDLTHATIKKYEDGQSVPSSATLIKLARALDVRTEYFFRPDTVALYDESSTANARRSPRSGWMPSSMR